jgi:hypothetical protein
VLDSCQNPYPQLPSTRTAARKATHSRTRSFMSRMVSNPEVIQKQRFGGDGTVATLDRCSCARRHSDLRTRRGSPHVVGIRGRDRVYLATAAKGG